MISRTLCFEGETYSTVVQFVYGTMNLGLTVLSKSVNLQLCVSHVKQDVIAS